VNHINKPTRYAANLQTPKTPDSVIAHHQQGKHVTAAHKPRRDCPGFGLF